MTILRFFLFAALSLSTLAQATVTPFFSPNGGIKKRIQQELSLAKDHVDIAMYSFADAGLVAQVKQLAQSGIKVRLILDSANQNKDKSAAFEAAGIDLRYVSFVMHHKFALVDGPQDGGDSRKSTLMSGSYNWASSAENAYDEDFLVYKNEKALILAYQSEFNALWNKAKDFGEAADPSTEFAEFEAPTSSAVFTSANFEAVKRGSSWSFRSAVSLEDGVAGKSIVELIDSAQSTIQIAQAHFRRRDFYEALVRALERGVKVEIVLDAQEFDGDGVGELTADDRTHLDEVLAAQGASVKYKSYSRFWNYMTAKQMHSKYLVVDGQSVLTGSFNWSENAELKTFENLVRFDDMTLAETYQDNFVKIFTYQKGGFKALLESVKSASGQGPCSFAPIALSGAEILKLRATYASGACR
jgi:phosphatidylserine/phosphatidylglycerophosphate/cardiolipin synthase-like enzyme